MSSVITKTQGQTLVDMLETDLISAGGQPLVTLFTNWKAHAGNGPMQAADLIQFTATAPEAGLSLAVEVEQQLLGLAIAKIQAKLNPVPAAAT